MLGSAITYIAPTLTSWITTNMVVASTVAAESSASYAAISSLFGATGARYKIILDKNRFGGHNFHIVKLF